MNRFLSSVLPGKKVRLLPSLLVCGALLGLGSGCGKKENPSGGKSSSGLPETAVEIEVVAEPEEKVREALKDQVRALAIKGDFAQLEAMAREFRENKSKFPNGDWKLRHFYSGFADLPDEAPESDWQNLLKQGEEWRKQHPKSVTPRIALGEMYRGYAWVARTSKLASEVTEEGGRLMGLRLQKAFQMLSEARQLPEQCPGWYGTTIRVALGANMPRANYEKIFEDAVKTAPDFGSIYDYKAYYLLPRWHGEPGEWEKFAISMMKRSDIPQSKEIFARAAIYLRKLGVFYDEFSDTEESWELLKESFRELEKNHPDSLEIKSTFCLICARLWDYKEAREQFKMLEGKADLSVWGTREDFQKMVEWVKFDDASMERARKAAQAARNK